MEATRAHAISLLNEAKLCGDPATKVTLLSQLTELVVRKERALTEEFVTEVVVLQMDQAPSVRRWLGAFLGEAASCVPSRGVLALATGGLNGLAADGVASVGKAAVLSCTHVLRGALGALALSPGDAELAALMGSVLALCTLAANSASGSRSDGLRIAGAKLREVMVSAFSSDTAPPLPPGFGGGGGDGAAARLPNAVALSQAADAQMDALLACLKVQANAAAAATAAGTGAGKGGASGPLLIVLLRSLSTLVVARPRLLPRLLPPLLVLAKEGGFRATGCDEAGPMPGGEVSVGNALRTALVSVMRSRSDASVPWRERMVEALGVIGAADAADSSIKYIQRQDYKDSKASKQRGRDPPPGCAPDADGGPAAKRMRASTPPPGSRSAHSAPWPGGVGAPNGGAGSAAGVGAPPSAGVRTNGSVPGGEGGGAAVVQGTSASDMRQLLQMLASILERGDRHMLDTFVANISPGLLADVVIANMAHLPPAPPHALEFVNMAGPVQVARAPSPSPPPPPPPPPPLPSRGAAGGRVRGSTPQQQQQPGAGPTRTATGPTTSASAAAPSAASAAAPSAAAPSSATPTVPHLHGVTSGLPLPHLSRLSTNVARHLPPGKSALPADARVAAGPVGVSAAAAGASSRGGRGGGSGSGPGPEPCAMSADTRAGLRDAAVGRLLALEGLPGVQDLSHLLLPRLAASDPSSLGDAMLSHVVSLWADDPNTSSAVALDGEVLAVGGGAGPARGAQLATAWLDAVFVEVCARGALSLARGSGSGGIGGAAASSSGGGGRDHAGDDEKKPWGDEAAAAAAAACIADVKPEGGCSSSAGGSGGGGGDAGGGGDDTKGPKPEASASERGGGGVSPAPAGASPSSSSPFAPPLGTCLDGSAYEEVLMSLLQGLRRAGCLDGALALLPAAPALPPGSVCAFLQELIDDGGDDATAVLTAARTLIQERPTMRPHALSLVLTAATSVSPDTRAKAIRLTVNQLLPEPGCAAAATEFATRALETLRLPRPPPAHVSSGAVPGTTGGAGGGGGGGEPSAADGQANAPGRGNGAASSAPSTAGVADNGGGGGGAEWSEAEASRYCELYAALATRQPGMLLPGLASALPTASSAAAAAALTQSACTLARALGPGSHHLASLVRAHPEGSDQMVYAMVDAVLEGALPSQGLVEACREWYATGGGVRALAPLVPVLPKAEVLSLLSQLLEMPALQLRTLYKRLAIPQVLSDVLSGGMVETPPMFSPSELLVLLHCPPDGTQVSQKLLMAAVDAALHAPETFPQQSLAEAISQMEVRTPLPALFMRTVIVAVRGAPRLRPFVADLMSRLISKQIWLDKPQWRGILLLVESTERTFFHVMLQLPAPVLDKCMLPQPGSNEPHFQWATSVKLAQFATATAAMRAGLVQEVLQTCEAVLRKQAGEVEAAESVQKAAATAAAEAAAAVAAVAAAEKAAAAAAAAAEKAAAPAPAPIPAKAAIPEDNFEIEFDD
ncbi:hypothetical protein FOA52_010531 [Chlamydomonas sp. UWO 241]|nr:hypothetical protein FOA52_010531 [Chlamydomonas sp. UWO 241]